MKEKITFEEFKKRAKKASKKDWMWCAGCFVGAIAVLIWWIVTL